MVKGDTPAQNRIDKKTFENLCGIQCTMLEICGWFDVDDKTLTTWCKKTYNKAFSEIYEEKKGKGKISLRRMQWQLAEKNPSMAIFLGKNYLGQKDIVVNENKELSKVEELLNKIEAEANDNKQ